MAAAAVAAASFGADVVAADVVAVEGAAADGEAASCCTRRFYPDHTHPSSLLDWTKKTVRRLLVETHLADWHLTDKQKDQMTRS